MNMKKTATRGNAAKKTAVKPVEFYVVSWADYDKDQERLYSGVMGELYADYDTAYAAVMCAMRDSMMDELENAGGPEEWKEDFGTDDADEIFKERFVKLDDYSFAIYNDFTESRYFIARFTTAHIKGRGRKS